MPSHHFLLTKRGRTTQKLLGQGEGLANLPVFGRVKENRAIFGAVEHLLLKRHVELTPGDVTSDAAHFVDGLDHHITAHDADLHTLHIFGFPDRLAVGVDAPDSVIDPDEADQTLLGELLVEVLLAIGTFVDAEQFPPGC